MNPRQVPAGIWKFISGFFSFTVVLIIIGLITFISLGELENELAFYGIIVVPISIFLSILIYGEDYCKIAINSIPYILMIPVYINILMVFSISRTDDITWGTRHITGNEVDTQTVEYQLKKVFYMFFFVICNIFFGLLFEQFDRDSNF